MNTSEPDGPAELPPLPVVSVDAVLALRQRLLDSRLREFVGCVPEGAEFAALVRTARAALGLPAEAGPALTDSLRHLAGFELSEAALGVTAWRLAGNAGRLRRGYAAPPWTRQDGREWVPVQVVGNRYAVQKAAGRKFGRSGRTLRFRVLAGTPCPLTIEQFWSNEKADTVAGAVGFSRNPPYHKAHHAELTSLRFMALVEPRLCAPGPGFFHVACPPAMRAYNRALMRLRRRVGFACPEGFAHECAACPRGAKSCPAACHPADYVVKNCPGCGREAWFDTDPAFVNDYCVQCQPLASAGIPLKRAAPDDPDPDAPAAG